MSNTIIAIAVLIAMSPAPALADEQGVAAQRNLTITNRVMMSESLNSDPWLVSQLSAVDDDRRPSAEPEDSRLPPAQLSPPVEPQKGRETDPELRTSPEAAHDLFQLLKKADPKQASKPK